MPVLDVNTIKRLRLNNLTVFQNAELRFANGLNLIAGENGSGKTHLLKICYSIVDSCTSLDPAAAVRKPLKTELSVSVARKLIAVFRPDELGRLVRRQPGRNRCEVECVFTNLRTIGFSFNTTSKKEVVIDKCPAKWVEKRPVYLPTRELLTIAPGFVALYENTHLEFEETYPDTCLLLSSPLARGPREGKIKELLIPIEEAMGGKVEADVAGRFYLKTAAGKMEMHLVAEGLRKLAMVARLIATGQLIDKGFLFWDEPEANLNPKVIKSVAKVILHLCQNGIQVFVATHSLFLMRELDILRQTEEFKGTPSRFFGLHITENGVEVQQGDTIDDIGEITSLQEELSQSDRYLDAEAQ
ncbi:MAG TPA: AAA family ATPase [Planctomycetaceae bacterium]|mgnify:CR=1 FL=1|nr:AAA family ATPase [Planctomycetaceae bacterium]HQZ63897.1 AAA family ATPase [Planctomycetaceae bacterium]